MAPFDPKKAPPRELTTVQGVKIVVDQDDDPPTEPASAPDSDPWDDEGPSAIVMPLGQRPEDRDAFIKSLAKAYGPFIEDVLRARKDVLPESAKDLGQVVILILANRIEGGEPIRHVRAFLRKTIHHVVNDHKKEWRPNVDREADFDTETSPDLDPEETAARKEEREKAAGYFERLTKEEQDAIRLVDFEELTFKQAAAVLRVAVGTVVTRHARAQAKLAEFARESDRETKLGLRRQPPPGR